MSADRPRRPRDADPSTSRTATSKGSERTRPHRERPPSGSHDRGWARQSLVCARDESIPDELRELLDAIGVPVAIVDRAGVVRAVNEAATALLDEAPEHLTGRNVTELLDPAELERLRPARLAAARGEPVRGIELRLRSAAAEPVYAALDVLPLRSAHGPSDMLVVTARNATALRELEERLARADRLATLGTLAAGVAHELNNPITTVALSADWLLRRARERGDPTEIDRLERIAEAAERLRRFAQDLVTYARPPSEPPRRLDLCEIIEQSLVFCDHEIARAGVRTECRWPAVHPRVMGVRGQLLQVFVNLVTNACQAIASSGTGSRLLLEVQPPVEGRVVARLSDDGPGIAAELVDRVFEPFFTTKPEGVGTGLGLSIVRGIVERHGGTVRVIPSVDAGATFEIRLPAAPAARPPSRPPPAFDPES
ncbi:MAG: ATP-binding protein [Myxococcota bacterium]|nr:ATP-binding protein [Myxococcota bacterium]MDW8363772.1 ATP-binding protein [Myxococcales bacterium]